MSINSNNIITIYGPAGTGKTQYLSSIIREIFQLKKTFVICTPTHSSLENIRKRLPDIPMNYFKTIYSYFRINYENDDVVGPIRDVEYIFIDEFGLIKKSLFKKIINKANDAKIYISGDVIQLNPIYLEKRFISLDRLQRDYANVLGYIIEHDYNNVFSTKLIKNSNKILLTNNLRSNDNVLNVIREIFYSDTKFSFPLVNFNIINLLLNGYVFISSKYEYLNKMYETFIPYIENKIIIKTTHPFKKICFTVGSKYIVSCNYLNLHNGDEIECISAKIDEIKFKINDEEIDYDKDMFLLPKNFITAHKSQGLTIDNVIICLDELFDISMLYTMITRAKNDIKFFTFTTIDENVYEKINMFKNIMKFYNYI